MSHEQLYSFSGDFEIEKAIKAITNRTSDCSSFYLCNLSDVIRKYVDWTEKIPRVKPFYAVKCNDDIRVLKTLANLGCSFDCASAGEIKKIMSLDVDPNRIIYANTTKQSSHVEFAKTNNVNLMTFDNEDEVYKIAKLHPGSNLILRIRYSSDKAKYKLGKKFGCHPDEAIEMLKLAKNFDLNVIGLSFHIGSSCEDYDVYCEAIRVCKRLFLAAHDEVGFHFNILDIGGGFPGSSFERINEFCEKINNSLEDNFPVEIYKDLSVFSEPGRYFVESAFTLFSTIQSRKVVKDKKSGRIQEIMYYLNEGVYSNFLFVPLGPEMVEPHPLESRRSDLKFKTTIWGPTCDSTDILCKDINLEHLDIGDILYFQSMGAYTVTLRTPFNGFDETTIFHLINSNDLSRQSLAEFRTAGDVVELFN